MLKPLVIAVPLALASLAGAQPLTTAVTYQGELKDSGAPATGLHDLRFRLYDAAAGGAQVGATLCADNVTLIAGRFTVDLDFPAAFAGQQRFLEIDVRADTGLDCSNAAGFTLLSPRQPLTPAPYSVFALNAAAATSATSATTAANATQLNGQAASFYQNASNLTSGTLPGGLLGGTYPGAVNLSNAGNSFGGSGAGLTGVNADLLDGLNSTAFLQSIPNPLIVNGVFGGNGVIQGISNANTGFSSAVSGKQTSPTGTVFGVYGEGMSTSGAAVFGWQLATSGLAMGGWFQNESTGGRAVFGNSVATSGTTFGGYFAAASPSGTGVSAQVNQAGAVALSAVNTAGGIAALFTGRVGIGTTTPLANLDVRTTGQGVRIQGALPGVDNGAYLAFANGAGTDLGYIGDGSSSDNSMYLTSYANDIHLYTAVGATLTAKSSGNVGIGTTTPASKLDVQTAGLTGVGASTSSSGQTASAVFGEATAASGVTYGVHGRTSSASGRGVNGFASSTTGTTTGVYGRSESSSGRGVVGDAFHSSGSVVGVLGFTHSTAGIGVRGYASSLSGVTYGVQGESNSSTSGYGVYSLGRTGASGTKSFRIDHPNDPENKYLIHYCPESPEVLNFYRGTVTLDSAGEAIVELPSYFAAINKDPSYQLTGLGAPMPLLHIARGIDPEALRTGAAVGPGDVAPTCSFRIAGGVAGAKVCWRVEAVRNDRWVQQHGAPVEVEKQDLEKGTYQHPELYAQPRDKQVFRHAAHPESAALPAPSNAASPAVQPR